MSGLINDSMVTLATRIATELANDLQVNGVMVLIAHSGDQMAVGSAIEDARDHDSEQIAMLRDALVELEKSR